MAQNSFSQEFLSREFNFPYVIGDQLIGKREDTVAVDNACWANGKEMQKIHKKSCMDGRFCPAYPIKRQT